MKIYLVGGAVRDKLLGLPVKDRDYVVVGATPEQMTAQGFKPVGADFPVFLHPQTKEEYALARTERKSGRGYKGFTVYAAPDVTLEDDLKRRDLTINAMAEDESGQLVDPFHGAADLKAGILRHVSPAFGEDPVRVWQELEGALGARMPSRFFEVLRACGALKRLFPELEQLYGVPQPEKHHPEIDTGVHTMMVLDAATTLTSDTRVRFAALMHDLGKGTTPKSEWPQHIGHEQIGRASCRERE